MKTIKYVENTYWIKKRGDWDFDCNDERNSEISVDEFSKLNWIDWKTAVEGADVLGLKQFTLDEVEEITLDEDGEIIDIRVIGYYNPSHMIYYGSTYGWEPMKVE